MIDPNSATPSAIRDSITKHGGINVYGKPYWRVIIAEFHTRKKRSFWAEWPSGTIEQFRPAGYTPDGKAIFEPTGQKPTRIVYEVRETPMWPTKGWILERWASAEVWGTREQWSPDAGPYPEEGEYVRVCPSQECPIWEKCPDINDLKQAISQWEYNFLNRPTNFDIALMMFVEEERLEHEKELDAIEEEVRYMMKHDVIPIFNSTSLEAQRLRNDAAEAAGVRSHIGAGQ